MLNTTDLGVSLEAALVAAKAEISAAALNADIPLLGPGLAAQADVILQTIDDLATAITTALSNLPDPADPAVIAAELSLLGGLTVAEASGGLSLDLSTQAILDLAGLTLAADLGVGGGVDLAPAADLSATLDLGLSFDVDAGGVVSRLATGVPTMDLALQGNVDVGEVGALGYLGIDIAPAAPPATPDIDLAVSLDLGPAGATALSISGGAGASVDLQTNMPTDLLPSIGARFVTDLAFDGTAALNGAATAVTATIGFEDITLDPGALVDFFDRTLGDIAGLATTFPLGEIVDILSQRIPVIDDVAPGSFDPDDDGVTVSDLVEKFSSGIDLGFVDAVADLLDLLKVIDQLGSLTEDIDLGDLTLSGEATAKIGNGESLSGATLFGGLPGGDILGDLGGFSDAISGALGGDFSEAGSLSIPLIEDPLATLGALLLNGFGADEVTLIEYDLPKLDFSVRPEIAFNFGPVAIIIEGRVGAETDFAVGFDTTGLDFAEPDLEEGFYITTDPASGGGYNPFASLNFGMGAGGGLDVLIGRVAVIGGVTGTVDLDLAGSDDGKTRPSDLAMFPCIFDQISGKLTAGLEVEFSIGKKPLKISERMTIGEVTLANFNGEICDHTPTGGQIFNAALASETSGGNLALHVGPAGILRDPPGFIGDLLDPTTNTYSHIEKELFHVTAAPPAADGTTDPEALAVHAFGFYETYTRTGGFNSIGGDGGTKRDRLGVDPTLAIAATFSGGLNDDTLIGGALADSLSGDEGDDWLIGNAGDDTLAGGANDDVLTGGAGADLLIGGAGFDEADYSGAKTGITLTPVSVAGLWTFEGTGGDAQGDTLQSIEYLRGSDFDDVLFGNPDAQSVLHGNDGNDSLTGGDKDDMLVGGKGADTLDGGLHENSTVAGDINGDVASYVLSDSAVFIDLTLGLFDGGDATGDVVSNVEVFQLTYYNDSFNGDGANNYIDALFGDDFLAGAGGQDTIMAAEGDDTVLAIGDGDSLNGGGAYFEGANAGYSDPGRDLLTYILATGGVTVDLGAGTGGLTALPLDVIAFADQYAEDLTITASPYSSFEDLTGTNFADSLTGDDGNNLIRGLNGADTLRGGKGSDTLEGGAGGDDIGGGNDTDYVDYSASTAAVTVDLAAGTASGGHAAGDTLTSIEAIIGSQYADDLTGKSGGNILDVGRWTAAGIDSVDGGAGDDTIIANYALAGTDVTVSFLNGNAGGAYLDGDTTQLLDWLSIENHIITTGIGNDFLNGDPDGTNRTPGRDVISTGAGDDTVAMGSGTDIIDLGSGADTAIRNALAAETFFIDGGTGIDALSANLSYETMGLTLVSDGPASIGIGTHLYTSAGGVFANFELFPELTTGSGADNLTVLGAGDKLWDTGAGRDSVTVDFGDNTLTGGESHTLVIGTQVTHLDELTMDFSAYSGITIDSFLDVASSENIVVRTLLDTDGDGIGTVESQRSEVDAFERLFLTGTSGNDNLRGVSPDEADVALGDVLDGRGGNDTIFGAGGDDSLIGGMGADSIGGGLGHDTIDAGAALLLDGADTADGGFGADLFVLGSEAVSHYGDSPALSDYLVIRDFAIAQGDALQLHGSAAEYSTASDGTDTEILDGATGARVALLEGVASFDLNGAAATYVDDGSAPGAALGGPAAFAGLSASVSLAAPFTVEHILPENDYAQGLVSNAVAKVDPNGTFNSFQILTEGDPRAFGKFENAPFCIGDGVFGGGIVISTGDVVDLPGTNLEANQFGAQPTAAGDVALSFESIGITAGGTEVFRALLPDIPGGLSSITLRDSNNAQGASGAFSGFDLDAVMLSTSFIDTVTPTAFLSGLDVFDFTPLGTHFTPGIQRDGLAPSEAFLRGTFSGFVDEGAARLGAFDFDGNPANGGAFAMGDGGAVTFDLTTAVDTTTPHYLYVGNAASTGEALGGAISASDRSFSRAGDLSTDLGTPGGVDAASIQVIFDYDFGAAGAGTEAAVTTELFNLVMVTEELPEAGGTFDPDAFEVKINGVSAALLSDDRQATFQNLASSPFTFHEDIRANLPGSGPFADVLRGDAVTTVLRVSGPIRDGVNVIEFSVEDGTDALLDTAIFLTPVIEADVMGTSAAETLDGSMNDDSFFPMAGADTMQGFDGRDRYVFGQGDLDGDVIIEPLGGIACGRDVIQLGANITDTPLFRRAGLNGNDLEITIGSEVLTVQDQYAGSALTPRVETLYSVALDQTWDLTAPILFTGLAGDDAGADRLRGSDLSERLTGGTGADNLFGYGGDDIYRFRLSDFTPTTFDSISETTDGGIDTIEILGPLPSDIRVQRAGVNDVNLVIHLDPASSTQGITVEDQYSGDAVTARVEKLKLGGTTLRLDGGLPFEGILGSETIPGTLLDDTLSGAGADTLEGFGGDDRYEVTAASMVGTHIVETAFGGTDRLTFTDATLASEILLQRDGSDDLLLTHANGSLRIIGQFDGADIAPKVETLAFADGTEIDLTTGLTFTGTTAADLSFLGTNGADTLLGLAGDDGLIGLDGPDSLDGGAGQDSLRVGLGGDTVTGGPDGDTFIVSVLAAGGNTVATPGLITDFTAAQGDILFLFDQDGIGAAKPFTLRGETTAALPGDALGGEDLGPGTTQFWWRAGSGGVTLFADTNDNRTLDDSDFALTLEGLTSIDASLFDAIASVEPALTGTALADTLTGSTSADWIAAFEGDDSISASGGDDSVVAGAGDDTVDGGTGNDTIEGGLGDDSLIGGGGVDVISGGDGHDTIDGSTGADASLSGDAGNDRVLGGGGNDVLFGGRHHDTLLGGSNLDTLDGGEGDDRLFGEIGKDSLLGGDGDDYLSGANANDTLEGGAGDDTLLGQGEADLMLGGDGNDSLNGGASADTLLGDAGNDTLLGGAFNDSLDGGADADTLDGGSGIDTLWGGTGDDSLIGGSSADTLLGGDGADTLDGGIGKDNLQGGSGNDSLTGGSANDTLDGGAGADTLDGGSSADVLKVTSGQGGDLLIGGAGLDTFDFEGGFGTATIADFTGQDVIDLADVASATGFAALSITYTADATIQIGGGDVITLIGVTGGLDASDFLF